MSATVHLTRDQVPAIFRTMHSGLKFKAVIGETVHIPASAGMWDGGSRDTYRALRLQDGAEIPLSNGDAAYHGSQTDQTVSLGGGIVVVRSSVFCGKDMGLTIYMHPSDAAPLLPVPSDLPAYGRLVLMCTAGFKASYGGKDRYQMGQEECRYGGDHTMRRYGIRDAMDYPTRAQWDAAKAELIGRGLLNKAGAITVAGRNAINVQYS
jgi:hypothetical protein